jgi:hypothetical protein
LLKPAVPARDPAPAARASTAGVAICFGVTGTAGFMSAVGASPVSAQVMMIDTSSGRFRGP